MNSNLNNNIEWPSLPDDDDFEWGYKAHWIRPLLSNEERRERYQLAVSLLIPPSWARVIRDWRDTKFRRFLALRGIPQIPKSPQQEP